MRKPIKIGAHEFKHKKDAIFYYKSILNSYDAGESLSDDHFSDLLDLLYFSEHDEAGGDEPEESINGEDAPYIRDIKIAKVQYGTKCFEVIWSDLEAHYISYLLLINKPKYNPLNNFKIACRNVVQEDVRLVKQRYFDLYSKEGRVKCQETSKLSKWEDLVIDHRQPNTFSVIVERFIEINGIKINDIEYITNEDNLLAFKDEKLSSAFKNYHKDKANLRIVRKECNSKRAYQAKILPQKKDLRIEH
jgi:hypothetical protein